MVQELDESFDALLYVGYHARSGSDGNPLSHTMSSSTIDYIRINGVEASEFLLHSHIAAALKIPVVFLSGDEAICREADSLIEGIKTTAVKKGIGNSTLNIQPELAVEQIKTTVEEALKADFSGCLLPVPDNYEMDIRFRSHIKAYKASFFPGAVKLDQLTVRVTSDRFFDTLCFRSFVV